MQAEHILKAFHRTQQAPQPPEGIQELRPGCGSIIYICVTDMPLLSTALVFFKYGWS
jgi:hypothetical protein